MTDYPRLTQAEWDEIIAAVAMYDNDLEQDHDNPAGRRQRKDLDHGFRKIQNWQEKVNG